jgi:hypothetical protein
MTRAVLATVALGAGLGGAESFNLSIDAQSNVGVCSAIRLLL